MVREFGTKVDASHSSPAVGGADTVAGLAESGAVTRSPVDAGGVSCRCPGAAVGVAGAAATWARMATRRKTEPDARMTSPARNRLGVTDTLPPATAPYRGGFYHGCGLRRPGFRAPWNQCSKERRRRSWAWSSVWNARPTRQ